jgi:hypothetical protein
MYGLLSGSFFDFCCGLQYPLLTGHFQRVAELPGIQQYLASPQRLEKVNGNGMG